MDILEIKNGIFEGKDGYLFHTNEDVLTMITGKSAMLDKWLVRFNQTIDMNSNHCSGIGGKYLFLIAPEKHIACRAFLPDEVVVSDNRYAVLVKRDDVIYPIEKILSEPQLFEPYLRKNTHWSHYGAFMAYRAVCDAINMPGLSMDDLNWEYHGDGVSDLSEETETHIKFSKKHSTGHFIYDNAKFKIGNLKISTNVNQNLPRLVIFRDSFAAPLITLLAESFSRIVVVAYRWYLEDLVELEKPDIVISQVDRKSVV